MKKKGLLLFFALALLALLLVVYFIVIPMFKVDNTPVEEETAEMLADFKDSDMTKLSFDCAPLGVSMSFHYKTGTFSWYYDDDEDFPVNQTILTNMAKTVASMPISRRLTTDEISLSNAGLDSPAYTVKATYGSKSYTYYFGDYNDFTACYYTRTDGDDSILLVPADISTAFTYDMLGLAQWDTIPTLSADNVKSFDIATALTSRSVTDNTQFGELSSLYIADVIDYKPTEAELTEYGLDSPSATIIVHYTENKAVQNEDGSVASSGIDVDYDLKLTLGALTATDDTLRYAKINDSNLVCTLYDDTLQTLLTAGE